MSLSGLRSRSRRTVTGWPQPMWEDVCSTNSLHLPAGRNFQGEKRSNKTHASRMDPEALIASKSHGIAARPS